MPDLHNEQMKQLKLVQCSLSSSELCFYPSVWLAKEHIHILTFV